MLVLAGLTSRVARLHALARVSSLPRPWIPFRSPSSGARYHLLQARHAPKSAFSFRG